MPKFHTKSETWLRHVFETYMEENGLYYHQELADYLGVTRQVLQNWMSRDRLSKQSLIRVSKALGEAYPINRLKGVGEYANAKRLFYKSVQGL